MTRLTPEAALKSMCGWTDREMKHFGELLDDAATEAFNKADDNNPSRKLRALIYQPLSYYLQCLADDDPECDLELDYLPGLYAYMQARYPGRGPQESLKGRNKLILDLFKKHQADYTFILEELRKYATAHNMPKLLINRDGKQLNARAIKSICDKHRRSEHV